MIYVDGLSVCLLKKLNKITLYNQYRISVLNLSAKGISWKQMRQDHQLDLKKRKDLDFHLLK